MSVSYPTISLQEFDPAIMNPDPFTSANLHDLIFIRKEIEADIDIRKAEVSSISSSYYHTHAAP